MKTTLEKYKEFIGKKFNYLTIEDVVIKNRHYYFVCRCDCGNRKTILVQNVIKNSTQSCGCMRYKTVSQKAKQRTKHNLRHHPLYHVWCDMKKRVLHPRNEYEKSRYMDKGITVCDEWKNNFKAFYDWALQTGWSDETYQTKGKRRFHKYTLDRIDNSKGYSPDNCHWATAKQQANNMDKRPEKNILSNRKELLAKKIKWNWERM